MAEGGDYRNKFECGLRSGFVRRSRCLDLTGRDVNFNHSRFHRFHVDARCNEYQMSVKSAAELSMIQPIFPPVLGVQFCTATF